MQPRISKVLLGLVFVQTLCVSAFGVTIQTDDFEMVRSAATRLTKKYSAREVLAVFDIDNTLLRMESDLGSDQWFDWQTDLLAGEDSRKVAPDFVGLLQIQGALFAIGNMTPPGGAKEVEVARAVGAAFPTIVLTSRSCHYEPGKSFSFFDATHRELKRNGYDFESSALEPKAGYGGSFVSFTPADLTKMGLTEAQKKTFGATSGARRSCYNRGVYMTAGQHKGLMLRVLLQKTGFAKRFKAVVAVDDKEKYCKQYEEALAPSVELHCVRYGAADPQVKAFQASDKKAVTENWKGIREAVEKGLSVDWK